MGWNTSAIFVDSHDPLTLASAATRATGEQVGADTATSGRMRGFLYTARTGPWHELWDPSLEHVLTMPDLGGHRGLSVIFSSVSSSYGFSLYDERGLVRKIIYSDGEPVAEDGAPLAVEARLEFPSWGPDEDFLWAVIEDVTGISFDLERSYDVHEVLGQ